MATDESNRKLSLTRASDIPRRKPPEDKINSTNEELDPRWNGFIEAMEIQAEHNRIREEDAAGYEDDEDLGDAEEILAIWERS